MAEEEEEVPEATDTPWSHKSVMTHIFNYLSLEDLKTSRRVCKTWSKAFTSQAHRFTLRIADEVALDYVLDHWGAQDKFVNFELPHGIPPTAKSMVSFFATHGQSIRSIVIYLSGWTLESLGRTLFESLSNLTDLTLIGDVPSGKNSSQEYLFEPTEEPKKISTNLTTLDLCLTNSQKGALPTPGQEYSPTVNKSTERLISDLISVSPNLKIIKSSSYSHLHKNPVRYERISNLVNRSKEYMLRSFDCVKEHLFQTLLSPQRTNLANLMSFDQPMDLTKNQMHILEKKNYPLQVLEISVSPTENKRGLLVILLQSLGSSLKSLSLRAHGRSMPDDAFTFLKQLETLRIDDYLGDLLFLERLPKLKKLTLEQFMITNFIQVKPVPRFQESKIDTLYVDSVRRPWNMQGYCIKNISILLPAIRNLSLMVAKDKELIWVYDNMPLLEHLSLHMYGVSDRGLSGYIETDAEKILESGYEASKYDEYEAMRRLSYIGNLQNLKSLTLRGDLTGLTPQCMEDKDVSIRHGLWILHGICNLRHIRSLSIQKSNLSSLELKRLVNTLDLSRLELIGCEYDQERMNSWIRQKTFQKPFEFVTREFLD